MPARHVFGRYRHRFVGALLCVLVAGCGDEEESAQPPIATEIAPLGLLEGASERTLTIRGSSFVGRTRVLVDGVARRTTVTSPTELTVQLELTDVATAGIRRLVVETPPPGGGRTSAFPFSIAARPSPAPTVTRMSPDTIVASTPGMRVTLTGTDFRTGATVTLASRPIPATVVSSTELTFELPDTLAERTGTFALTLANPFPTERTVALPPLVQRAPLPALSSLSPIRAVAGDDSLVLRVAGGPFVRGSAVQVDGVAVPTTFVRRDTLVARLGPEELRAPGTRTITVTSPEPGGGTSAARELTLDLTRPVLTMLPTNGIAAGRAGATLPVHGSGFVSASVVHWNGAPRPTQWVAGTRLFATLPASDLATPGRATVTVVTPGEAPSAPATVTVRPVGTATITEFRTLDLGARDVASDRTRGRLYLSLPTAAPADGNTVVALDPVTGAIVDRVAVGSQPARLALSDDDAFLYVAIDGASALRRITLDGFAPGPLWSLGSSSRATDMAVLPGLPRSVVVVRTSATTGGVEAVALYEDGAVRGSTLQGFGTANLIASADEPGLLYGYFNQTTATSFQTIVADGGGLRLRSAIPMLLGVRGTLLGAAGRVYAAGGDVLDAARGTRVAQLFETPSFNNLNLAIAVDVRMGRVYVVPQPGLDFGETRIVVHDLATFERLGSILLPGVRLSITGTGRMVRWGVDGLALLVDGKLHLVRSPLIGS